VAWTAKHRRKDGTVTYTGCYRDLGGVIQTAGTSTDKEKARRAAERAEDAQTEGRVADPRKGRQRFKAYAENTWLPNHVLEASTRGPYRYCLKAHIVPWFGPMRMAQIWPSHVREWVTDQIERGLSPDTIAKNMTILSAIFTTALNDRVIHLHPCKGVKTPKVAIKPLIVLTPEQFDHVYTALKDVEYQLMVEVDIESGLRWGELTELRPKDINLTTGIITVSRVVVEVCPEDHPTGGRFLVKAYPKDGEFRRLKISAPVVGKVREYITTRGLGPDDLLFPMVDPTAPVRRSTVKAAAETEELTEPNAKGRRYRHGTLTAYTTGGCHCQLCKDAFAGYRARRRSDGKDRPARGRRRDTDGHIPADWFRTQIWHPAVAKAKIGRKVTPHGLRHAHASWLLAGGADLAIVQERLGHESIRTTQRYVHTLPTADETALLALARIRGR